MDAEGARRPPSAALPPAPEPALDRPRPPGPPPPAGDPDATTAWLIERIHRLDQENRSGWKDLIGRLAGLGRGPA